LAVIVINKLFV